MSTSSSPTTYIPKSKKEKKAAKNKEATEKIAKPEPPKTPLMDKNPYALPPKFENTAFGTFDNTDYDDAELGLGKEEALADLSNFEWPRLVSENERNRILSALSSEDYLNIAASIVINESKYAIVVYSDKNTKMTVAWSVGGPDSFHKPALNSIGISTTVIFLQYPNIVETVETKVPVITDESAWSGWLSTLANSSKTMNDVSFMGITNISDTAMSLTLMMHPKRIDERPVFKQSVKPRRTLVKIDTTNKKQSKNAKLQSIARNSQSMMRSIKAVQAQSNLTRVSQLETMMEMLEMSMESSDNAQDLDFEDNEITDYY